MKNLLFFASDFKIGLSSLLTDQLISIHKSGINVYAVAGENQQEEGNIERINDRFIPIQRIIGLDAHKDFFKLVSSVKDVIFKKNIDIVHVQNNWQLAICACVLLLSFTQRRFEIVYTIHGFRNNKRIKSMLAQLVIGSALFLFANHIICMTKFVKSKFKLLSYKIKLIPLGISDDFFLDDFDNPNVSALNLIFPAQFRPGKNQDLLIRAFAKYIRITGDDRSTLTLPGCGIMLDKMKSLAIDLGIEKQVFFPGLISRNDVKKLYLDNNIAVVASNSETFGQSIVEPFVLGRCVISTPVGIAPELLAMGINGFIFENEEELTTLLCNISKDKNVLSKIGKTNFMNREKFSWESITKQYIEQFRI